MGGGGGNRTRVHVQPKRAADKILDPLDLIHALTTQIPDEGQHLVR